jgi:hypothetical protein
MLLPSWPDPRDLSGVRVLVTVQLPLVRLESLPNLQVLRV